MKACLLNLPFISQFFTAKEKILPWQSVDQPPIPSESDPNSSDEESIDEHLDQIFGGVEAASPSKNSEPESHFVCSQSA